MYVSKKERLAICITLPSRLNESGDIKVLRSRGWHGASSGDATVLWQFGDDWRPASLNVTMHRHARKFEKKI
jgi:hypothetical protein